MWLCPSSLRRWSLFLLVGSTDPYNHTYYESFWWKLFKNHKRTQIQRRRQWQRQRQRQIHRQSAWKTQHMLYFWNPDDLLIPNLMIDTSPWSSCSRKSPWLDCSGHTISSTGPSVSPFRDFFLFIGHFIHLNWKISWSYNWRDIEVIQGETPDLNIAASNSDWSIYLLAQSSSSSFFQCIKQGKFWTKRRLTAVFDFWGWAHCRLTIWK